jgi:hypothetical protein
VKHHQVAERHRPQLSTLQSRGLAEFGNCPGAEQFLCSHESSAGALRLDVLWLLLRQWSVARQSGWKRCGEANFLNDINGVRWSIGGVTPGRNSTHLGFRSVADKTSAVDSRNSLNSFSLCSGRAKNDSFMNLTGRRHAPKRDEQLSPSENEGSREA